MQDQGAAKPNFQLAGALLPFGEPANPYATPYEILPEWFLFPTFQILRVVPNKLLGITAIAAVPVLLM